MPNELTTSDTDGDEQTPVAGLRKPSKCKVRIEKCAAKPIQNQNSDSTNENRIHLRSEESLSASDNSDSNNIDGEGPVVKLNLMDRPNKRKVKNKSLIKQIRRKRVRHEESWLSNVRKQKLLKKEAYVNKKGREIKAKTLKPPCTCKMKCFVKISEKQWQQIFNSYRCEQSSSDLQRQFIICFVVERSRKRNVDSGRNKEHFT